MAVISLRGVRAIEPAVFTNFTLRIIQVMIQFFVILIVGHYFNAVELGYYYVLNSYTSLAVFFELGVSFVVMQNAAHESASIEKEAFFSRAQPFHKLSSLFRFTIKWFCVTSLLFFLFVTYTARYFFHNNQAHPLAWQGPLSLLTFGIALNLFMGGIYSFLEGCRFIYEMSIIRIAQNSSFLLLFFLAVLGGGGLYAYGLATLLALIISLVFLFSGRLIGVVRNLYLGFSRHVQFNWMKDIFPLQWRCALSAISGFFIFQLMNLLAFKFQGPVLSGQLGFTISIINGIMSVAMVWFTARIPLFATMVAKRNIDELNVLFRKTLWSSALSFIFLVISFLVFKSYFIDFRKLLFSGRFLPDETMLILLLNTFINVFIFGWASYCRSNRQEPFLYCSVVGAFINSILSYFLLKYSTIHVFSIAFLLSNLIVGLPWAYVLYRQARKGYKELLIVEEKTLI